MNGRAILALAGLVLASMGAAATTQPRGELIVFSSNRGGSWSIWAVRPDGSQMRQLTRPASGEQDVDGAISPDGMSILFTSTRGGRSGIWRAGVDGTNPQRICDGDQGEWSNDGRKIVLRRGGQLLTRDLASGQEKVVSPEGWEKCSGPAWSPDGRTIAFARLEGGGNAIYLVPCEGAKATKLYDQQGACEPHWSPDGKTIVYETETHLCAISPDGTKNRLITYYGGMQRYGRFSPDGTKVVFCQAASPEGPWELYVVPAGGGTPTKLTEGGSDMYPDWK